jgi:predicted nucleic acid binding AN1-type Zn finger protein
MTSKISVQEFEKRFPINGKELEAFFPPLLSEQHKLFFRISLDSGWIMRRIPATRPKRLAFKMLRTSDDMEITVEGETEWDKEKYFAGALLADEDETFVVNFDLPPYYAPQQIDQIPVLATLRVYELGALEGIYLIRFGYPSFVFIILVNLKKIKKKRSETALINIETIVCCTAIKYIYYLF